MCCPHLKIYVEQFIDKTNVDIPIYLLPPKMYGLMKLEEILTDAKDVIKLYQKNKTNPVHFPNEENLLRITRVTLIVIIIKLMANYNKNGCLILTANNIDL
ncbi:hypothetical protein SD457_09280 [Coprobacillaceae bacterium CR2/5/TPMF4]|nr:hypothetical protein SD457_09280 [Coprobacillaceae bacterium CR2/5/TPMF4]